MVCTSLPLYHASDLARAVSARSPHLVDGAAAPALHWNDGSGGIATMDRASFIKATERLAAQLQEAAPTGGPVLLMLPRCPALTIAQAAVHLAGHTFVPMDVAWPVKRVQAMLEETHARAFLYEPSASAAAEAVGSHVLIELDQLGHAVGLPSPVALPKPAPPPDVFCNMFTSGLRLKHLNRTQCCCCRTVSVCFPFGGVSACQARAGHLFGPLLIGALIHAFAWPLSG